MCYICMDIKFEFCLFAVCICLKIKKMEFSSFLFVCFFLCEVDNWALYVGIILEMYICHALKKNLK